ncbi:MAG TPA: SH3 domain-containing protein [Candidatus Rifleibacterium sp.]|nr:SH3 domain-containing protein [Candidatus Rifleibacterium sp.]HPT47419.1 SH3 domain-containing protein [Candidatus Rifleibacterium sp.]
MRRSYLMFGFLLMFGLHGSNPIMAQNDPFAVGNESSTVTATIAADSYEINKAWVNVRSGPGIGNSVLKTLPMGSSGVIKGEKNGWYQLDFGNGLTGWVRNDLVSKATVSGATTATQPQAQQSLANAKQFERWNRHLGKNLLNFERFPWYWKLNRANKAYKNGDYAEAYKLAAASSGNPAESLYMQAMCLEKLGKHDQAASILKQLEKHFEDIVFARKIQEIAQPYIDEPIVFKFGGFDDLKTYQKKKGSGNQLGLESRDYYENYVDINTWKWRSKEAYNKFQKIGGIDCSGFVQMLQKEAYGKAGVAYPISGGRTSTSGLWSQKYTSSINPGVKPPPPPDIRPGDMILLDYGHNRYGHSMIYKGTDSQGNILVMQMGNTAEVSILAPHKYEFYKGTYRMNGMDKVRKAMTA